jgi:hypothetical protein
MSDTPGTVTLPSDAANVGKLIDNTVVLNEASIAVYRQGVTIGDPAVGGQRLLVNPQGGIGVAPCPIATPQLTPFVINSAASGALQIASAMVGLRNKLHRLILYVGGPTTLTFEDGTTPLSGPIPLLAYGNILLDFSGEPWFTSSANSALNLNSSNAVQLSGTAWYVQS